MEERGSLTKPFPQTLKNAQRADDTRSFFSVALELIIPLSRETGRDAVSSIEPFSGAGSVSFSPSG